MNKAFSLTALFFLCVIYFGFGQILTFEFNGLVGNELSASSNYNDTNLNSSSITRGSGLTASNNANRFNATSWALTSINTAVSGDDYMEFSINPQSGYKFSVTNIVFNVERSSTGLRGIALRSSIDSYSSNIDGEKAIADNTNLQVVTFSVNLSDITANTTFRIYGWSEATGGSGGFEGPGNDIIVNGSVTTISTDTPDFCNLQSPSSGSINVGGTYDIFSRVYEPGVTDGAGAGANILGWIGYSTTNTDPSLGGFTWVNASYNGDFGNDDEYTATLSGLTSGTYYYASRFQYNGGPYVYGGINSNGTNGGNFWDGTNFVNGILSVDTVDFCNLEFPEVGNITLGGIFDVYGQVYEFGITDSAGQGAGITAEIGYSTTNTNPNTWTDWISAGYNNACADCNGVQNDEYFGNLGAAIASPGTYYYTMRYTLNSGAYSYGGILADGTDGNFWDGVTYISGILTVQAPEINVEGDVGSFPDISDGDTTPSFLDNTQFSDRAIGASQTKSFRIQNLGNSNLTISNLQMLGSNPSDFTLTLPSALPIVIPPNDLIVFDVTFSPTAIGVREATVTITNDDTTDNESTYDFLVRGNGLCSGGTLSLSPSTGPVNTIVTVTGNNFGGSTTGTLNGIDVSSNLNVINSTTVEFTVPTGAFTGILEITNNLGCPSSESFTVIDTTLNGCDGGNNLTINDLFISEVTDKGSGSHSYVEIFNGTGNTYNLENYEVRIHNNGAATATSTIQLSGSLASGAIYVVGFGGTNANDMEGGYTADVTSGVGGINDNDHIRLYYDDGSTENWIDLWGNTSNTTFTISSNDYVYRRKNTGITVPSTTWDENDWNAQTPVDYTDIGNFNYTIPTPPIVNSISASYTSCEDVTLTVNASQGVSGGNGLAYQWYYFDPNDVTSPEWKPISDNATFSNSTTNVLTITNANALSDYQFYCEVRENDATCYSASDAIKFDIATVIWNGDWVWSDGTPNGTVPTAANIVTLNTAYNTTNNGGSFSACSLIVNTGTLFIDNGHYVEVINNVDINNTGRIITETKGSFIQRGVGSDAGYFSNSGSGFSDVIKTTAELNDSYDYTYWSSPITNATTDGALFASNPNRRFWFNANNFVDGNADGVDDDANAWTLATGSYSMTPGQGFAATHGNFFAGFGVGYDYTFRGDYNTGDITYPVVYNTLNDLSLHWNLIGNPYPSALDADLFFAENGSVIYEAIYMWSHVSQPNGANPGNEVLNFNQNDYVTINFIGEAGNGSDTNDDGVIDSDDIPKRRVPSGQGFFIPSRVGGNVTYTNAMRVSGDGSNDQFFRTSVSDTNENSTKESFWLNLSSNNGIYSQICVAYADIATDGYDGNAIDTKRNYAGNAGMIYSLIDGDSYSNYVIQGKALSSLDEDEVVPIGFGAYISTSEIYTLDLIKKEGAFLNNNPVYIKDSYLNIIHDLTESKYQFTSEGGIFNDRFSIVFKNENTLSEDELALNENGLSIVELQNGNVQFTVKNSSLTISKVTIIDLQGRLIYKLNGSSSREVYSLNNLSTAAFIAKVELSNGLVITKKAIKKR